MTDSRLSGRPGRRMNLKCVSPALSAGSDAGSRQTSPYDITSSCSAGNDAQESACAVNGHVKDRTAASPMGDTTSSHEHKLSLKTAGESRKDESRPSARVGRSSVALGMYVALSILTVFWTKHLVGGKIPTPLFLSWVQQAVGLVLYSLVSTAVSLVCNRSSIVGRALSAGLPVVRVRPRVLLRVLPLSFCFVGMIGSANLCLQRVQVSVYQVARSLTLVFSLLLSVCWLKQKVVLGEVCSCLLVAAGFALMTAVGSDAASMSGYFMGACASLFQAAYTVLMKSTLNALQSEADTLIQTPKLSSSYQLINDVLTDASCVTSKNKIHNDVVPSAEAEAPSVSTCRGSASPIQCTGVVVGSTLEMSPFSESKWQNEGAKEDVLASPLGKRIGSAHELDAVAEYKKHADILKATVCDSSVSNSERRNVASGHNASSESKCESNASCSVGTGAPRAEPLCMFFNMFNALCLFPIFILLSDEPQVLMKLAAEGGGVDYVLTTQVIGLGVVTFVLGSSVFWTVSLTSPLSFSVAGYVKTLLQVAVAMIIWDEHLSLVESIGFLLTLSGSLWYSISRCRSS